MLFSEYKKATIKKGCHLCRKSVNSRNIVVRLKAYLCWETNCSNSGRTFCLMSVVTKSISPKSLLLLLSPLPNMSLYRADKLSVAVDKVDKAAEINHHESINNHCLKKESIKDLLCFFSILSSNGDCWAIGCYTVLKFCICKQFLILGSAVLLSYLSLENAPSSVFLSTFSPDSMMCF